MLIPNTVDVSVDCKKCDRFIWMISMFIIATIVASTALLVSMSKALINTNIKRNNVIEAKATGKKLYDVDHTFVDILHDSHEILRSVIFDVPLRSDNYLPNVFLSCVEDPTDIIFPFELPNDNLLSADDTLCDFTNQYKFRHGNLRLFMTIRNPIVNTVISYLEQKDRESDYFNFEISKLSFEKYLRSSFMERNLLTRSITCKSPKAVLTRRDVEYAKGFLKKKVDVLLLSHDYQTSAQAIVQHLFLNESNTQGQQQTEFITNKNPMVVVEEHVTSCVHHKISTFWDKYSSEIQHLISNYITAISSANNFDIELYSFLLGSSDIAYNENVAENNI